MTALKYAKQIVREVKVYQKIKASMHKLTVHVHHYNKLKSATPDHRKKAVIAAHLVKLHKHAAVIKKKAKISHHKLQSIVKHMYKSL